MTRNISYYVESYWQELAEICGTADELRTLILTARGIGIDLTTDYGVMRIQQNSEAHIAMLELYQWGLLEKIHKIKTFMQNKYAFLEGQEPNFEILNKVNGELAEQFPKYVKNIPEELKAIGIELKDKKIQLIISRYPEIMRGLGLLAGMGFFERIKKVKQGYRMDLEKLRMEVEQFPKTADGKVDTKKLTLYQSLKYKEFIELIKFNEKKEEEKKKLFNVFAKTIEQAKKKIEQEAKLREQLDKLYSKIAETEDKVQTIKMEIQTAKEEINEVAGLLVAKGVNIEELKGEVAKLNETQVDKEDNNNRADEQGE